MNVFNSSYAEGRRRMHQSVRYAFPNENILHVCHVDSTEVHAG